MARPIRKGSAKGGKPGSGAKKKAAKARKPAAKSTPKPAAKARAKAKKAATKPLLVPAVRRPVKNRPSVVRMPSARPAPHKAPALNPNIYERDLDKNAANHAMLTPIQFLERSASVHPDHLAL